MPRQTYRRSRRIPAGRGVPWAAVEALAAALRKLGYAVADVAALAGDASQRRFFRARLADGRSVVACLYPEGSSTAADRDHAVQVWGCDHKLPLPQPLALGDGLTVSADVGDDDLERMLARAPGVAVARSLDALALFQACATDGAPTAPFDAGFFRRELAGFEDLAMPGGARLETAAFLDELAVRVAAHPYRLVHRDFHANNLFLHDDRVWAVDFQDMRAGPDTYDLVSLLRERAGAGLIPDPDAVARAAAARFLWPGGWERRYLECAAQRGLKVIGTFLRLAAAGRDSYLRYLPAVRRETGAALAALSAPRALQAAAVGEL
jgi:hypothetical protein